MRSLHSLILLISLLLPSATAAAVDKQHRLNTVQDALLEPKAEKSLPDGPKAGATNSEAVSSLSTKFNDVEVPPMQELTGDDLEKTLKDGYWFIKHYSPYCGHCKEIGMSDIALSPQSSRKHWTRTLSAWECGCGFLKLMIPSTDVANSIRILLFIEPRSWKDS